MMKTRRGERDESPRSKIAAVVTSPAAREERGAQETLPSVPTQAGSLPAPRRAARMGHGERHDAGCTAEPMAARVPGPARGGWASSRPRDRQRKAVWPQPSGMLQPAAAPRSPGDSSEGTRAASCSCPSPDPLCPPRTPAPGKPSSAARQAERPHLRASAAWRAS